MVTLRWRPENAPPDDLVLGVTRKTVTNINTRSKHLKGPQPHHNLADACEPAGVRRFSFKDLRSLFGTRLIETGVDLWSYSRIMGHSLEVAEKHYLRQNTQHRHDAMMRLSKAGEGKVINFPGGE